METNNSFKQLGKEEENRYPHPPPETEMGVMGNVRVFNFMSNVLELYLPKILDMFVTMVGGVSESSKATFKPGANASEDNTETPTGEPK